MATPLSLLKSFSTGQGISGGISQYVNYPQDHDTNYTAIESTVNALISEVAAASLNNNQIVIDTLVSSQAESLNNSNGRFSPWEAKVTYSGSNVTVTSGRIYMSGRRIEVTGATLAAVGGAADPNYVKVDINGTLTISTSSSVASNQYNLALLGKAAGNFNALTTDYLAFQQSTPLCTADTINRIFERVDGAGGLIGRQHPAIRTVDATGDPGDAGFAYEAVDQFSWVSQRASGHASGSTVVAAQFYPTGQFHLMEQARLHAIRSTNQSIATGAGFTAITWDAPVANSSGARTWRREPQNYNSSAFLSASSATITIPTGSQYSGTYHFTAFITIATAGASGYVEARIRATNGTATDIALVRVGEASTGDTTVCLSGMMDLAAADTVQVQVRHGNAGSINVTFARVTALLVGGPV